tara:strand:+ start:66 stop:1775 length:1710 start_codon:yes stop_codon:yes gene_type:complete
MADANIIVIGGNADDQDHDIPDNTDPAWRVHQGATDYIVVDTTNSSEKVELCGSGTGTVVANNAIVVQKADNTAEFRVQNSGSIRSSGMGLGSDDDILRLFADDDAQGTNSAIVFHVDGSEHMRIDDAGDVGIGTTNPTSPLHVKVTDDSSKWLTKIEADGTTQNALKVIVDGSSGTGVSFEQGGNYSVWMNNGRVGFGTSSPDDTKLHLARAGTAKGTVNFLTIENTVNASDMDGTGSAVNFKQYYYDAGSPAADDSAKITVATETDWTSTASTRDSRMTFETSDGGTLGEKMRITSSGVNMVNTGTVGTGAVAIGNGSSAAGTYAITVGRLSTATGTASVTVGNGSSTNTKSMVFSPDNGYSSGANAQAIGYSSRALQSYEQSFVGANYDSKNAAALRKFVVGQCQTTDGTTTTMLNAEAGGSTAMTVNTTNSSSTDKSSISFFKVRVMSSVTSAGGTGFAVGDFLCREYDLAIYFKYSSSASTIAMYSDAAGTTIASAATLYAARSNVRASNSTISHATNGIVDAITLTTSNSAERGSWQFTVDSADTGATIRHTCHVDQVDQILA